MNEYEEDRLVIRKLLLDDRCVTVVDENISCGTGGPVESPFQERLTLWERFLKPDDEAFIVQTFGDSMVDAGIENNDSVVFVKRSRYKNGDIVLAFVNGEARIKYYYEVDNEVWLVPGNEKYKPVMIQPTDDFYINGVMVQILKDVKKPNLKISKLVKDEKMRLPFMRQPVELPTELEGNRAKAQLDFLVENELLQKDWQPVPKVPQWQLGGIADRLGEYFDLDDKWRFFSVLWNINKDNLRVRWYDAKGLKKEKEFSKNILSKIR